MPGITHFPKHRNILRTSQTKPEMKHMQEVGPGGWGILADSGSSPSSGEPTPSRGWQGAQQEGREVRPVQGHTSLGSTWVCCEQGKMRRQVEQGSGAQRNGSEPGIETREPGPMCRGALPTGGSCGQATQINQMSLPKEDTNSARNCGVSSAWSGQCGWDPHHHPLLGPQGTWGALHSPGSAPGPPHQTPGAPSRPLLPGSLQCSCKTEKQCHHTQSPIVGTHAGSGQEYGTRVTQQVTRGVMQEVTTYQGPLPEAGPIPTGWKKRLCWCSAGPWGHGPAAAQRLAHGFHGTFASALPSTAIFTPPQELPQPRTRLQ